MKLSGSSFVTLGSKSESGSNCIDIVRWFLFKFYSDLARQHVSQHFFPMEY